MSNYGKSLLEYFCISSNKGICKWSHYDGTKAVSEASQSPLDSDDLHEAFIVMYSLKCILLKVTDVN